MSEADDKALQIETDKKFIKMADLYIKQSNKLCEDTDHQLVNASLLYASARFCAFITAAMSENEKIYDEGTDAAIEFYMVEFEKMLKEHMKQYKTSFKTRTEANKKVTPPYPH